MEFKEDKSLNGVNVWGAPAIHPPSHLHSLSVWPYSTCMTPDHSSSRYPFITPVTSAFHFSAPRPEPPPPSPVTDDAIWVDYLEYHEECMITYLLWKVTVCSHWCGIRHWWSAGFMSLYHLLKIRFINMVQSFIKSSWTDLPILSS